MSATCRDVRGEDLLLCLNVDQRRIGDGIIGRTRAISMWRRLLRCESFKGQVFEFNPPLSGHQIIGFGCGVFVDHEFVGTELANPQPGLNDRLIASMEPGSSSVVLSDAKLRALNTYGTLDMVVLYANWMDSLLAKLMTSERRIRSSVRQVRATRWPWYRHTQNTAPRMPLRCLCSTRHQGKFCRGACWYRPRRAR